MTNTNARSLCSLLAVLAALAIVPDVRSEVPTREQQSDFIAAVWACDIDRVKSMLEENPGYADSEDDGVSALLFAVFARKDRSGPFSPPEQNPLVTLVASKKSSLDIFEAAVLARKEKVAELLGENPDLINSAAQSGWTALHYAAFSGDADLVLFLVSNGAAVNQRAGRRASKIVPLQAALLPQPQQFDAAKMLLDSGADVMVRSSGGFSPLHEAAQRGSVDLILLFMDAGAELDAKTDDCKSALDLAEERDQADATRLLRELENQAE